MQANIVPLCSCAAPGFCSRHFMQKDRLEWLDCLKREGIRRKLDHRYGMSYFDMDSSKREIIPRTEAQKTEAFKTPLQYDRDLLKRTKIAVLGHAISQFDNIIHSPYMEYFLLQDLDLGIYSRFQSNDYAESRAYLCDLFDYDKYDYVGVVSASWNSKYDGLSIDDFHDWRTTSILYNNQNIVLCAHPANFECRSVFDVFENDFAGECMDLISSFTGPRQGMGLWANQIICHKSIYIELEKFHRMILPIIADQKWPLKIKNGRGRNLNIRAFGLILEAVTNLWFASRPNLLILDNATIKKNWYA